MMLYVKSIFSISIHFIIKFLNAHSSTIHDDISLIRFVIPGLTKPAPYLIRGNLVFFWIPAGVYPVLDTGQE
jgi:hypothetical protein